MWPVIGPLLRTADRTKTGSRLRPGESADELGIGKCDNPVAVPEDESAAWPLPSFHFDPPRVLPSYNVSYFLRARTSTSGLNFHRLQQGDDVHEMELLFFFLRVSERWGNF